MQIYDGLSKENFLLRCHVIMWTGDMPAIAKLMCMSGHNAYFGCRFCHLKGTYSEKSRHVYYPCVMPGGSDNSDYNPEDLPERNEHDFFNDVNKIINEKNKTTKASYIKDTGIINFILIYIY